MAERGIEEEFLTCPVCFQVFKDPKTLSCLHRFCGKCLHNYIISQKKSLLTKLGGFYCPVCREAIKSPDPHVDPMHWSDLVKTDFYLANLISFVDKNTSANADPVVSNPSHKCDVHKDKELDLYCVDCETVICHICAGIKHRGCGEVTTLEEVATKQKGVTQKTIQSVKKVIDEINKSKQKGLNRLEKMKSDLEFEIKAWANEWYSAVQKEEQKLLTSLESQFEKVYQQIKPKLIEFENRVTSFLEKSAIFKNDSEKLSDLDLYKLISKGLDVNSLDLKSYKNVVEGIGKLDIQFKKCPKKDLNLGHIATNSEKIPEPPKTLEITNQSGTHTYALEDSQCVLYQGTHSPNINNISNPDDTQGTSSIRKSFRAKLARVMPSSRQTVPENASRPRPVLENTKSPPPVPPKRPNPENSVRNASLTSETDQESLETNHEDQTQRRHEVEQTPRNDEVDQTPRNTITKLRTISTRFREDHQNPKLRDLIVSKQGSAIIVTDWANQSVKAFFVRREMDSCLDVGGKPWSITQLSDILAAVSLPLTKQICIIKITSPLMMQNSFIAAKNYSGLATLNNKMLVASGGSDPPSVDIINLYGEVLKSFSTSSDGSPLFMYPSYVCVTAAMFILVSDKKQGAIICLSHKGEVKFKFQPPSPKHLQDPCGLCTTPSGHVMLLETRGLLQLTPGGQFDRPILRKVDGHINDPKGIAMDSNGHLYITTDEQEVVVFKL